MYEYGGEGWLGFIRGGAAGRASYNNAVGGVGSGGGAYGAGGGAGGDGGFSGEASENNNDNLCGGETRSYKKARIK